MNVLSLDFSLELGGHRLSVRQKVPTEGLTTIIGPSGAGKTTLLRAIAGFQRTGGQIDFCGGVWEGDGVFVPPHARRIGFVFQEPRLFPHLTVAGNLAYGAARAPGRVDMAAVVARLSLANLMGRSCARLSGGEAQRVALARALLSAPRLLLMDEPLSALDLARREEILPHIELLRDEGKVAILYVSHSMSEVARLANHVMLLKAGQVIAFGAAEEVLSGNAAQTAFGDRALGSLITATVIAHEPDGLCRLGFSGGELLVPDISSALNTRLRLMINPRDVMVATRRPEGISALNILAAQVRTITISDGSADLMLDAGGTPIRAQITARSLNTLGLQAGSEVFAVLKSVALARG